MPRVLPAVTALWMGRVPLRDAFWNYAVFWGLLINLAATLASMAVLVLAGGGPDPAPWAALLSFGMHLLPVPYNLIALVGIWRSAGAPHRPAGERVLARTAAVGWMICLTLI